MFIPMLLIMFILFLSLVSAVFELLGSLFKVFEVALILVFMLCALILMYGAYARSRWVWPAMLVFFSANILNLLIVYRAAGFGGVALPMAIASIGFIISAVKSEAKEKRKESKKEEAAVTVYEPGKYVASKMGKKFHIPKCDWAEKIHEKRRVWFESKEEAEKEGFKACECVKE